MAPSFVNNSLNHSCDRCTVSFFFEPFLFPIIAHLVTYKATVNTHGSFGIPWSLPQGSEDSAYLQGATSRPRVVKRGMDEFNIDDGEPEKVDHLLFLVHGIGSVCDLKFRTVEEVGELEPHFQSLREVYRCNQNYSQDSFQFEFWNKNLIFNSRSHANIFLFSRVNCIRFKFFTWITRLHELMSQVYKLYQAVILSYSQLCRFLKKKSSSIIYTAEDLHLNCTIVNHKTWFHFQIHKSSQNY